MGTGDRRLHLTESHPNTTQTVSERSLKAANRPPRVDLRSPSSPCQLVAQLMTEGEGCSPKRCLLAWTFKRK